MLQIAKVHNLFIEDRLVAPSPANASQKNLIDIVPRSSRPVRSPIDLQPSLPLGGDTGLSDNEVLVDNYVDDYPDDGGYGLHDDTQEEPEAEVERRPYQTTRSPEIQAIGNYHPGQTGGTALTTSHIPTRHQSVAGVATRWTARSRERSKARPPQKMTAGPSFRDQLNKYIAHVVSCSLSWGKTMRGSCSSGTFRLPG